MPSPLFLREKKPTVSNMQHEICDFVFVNWSFLHFVNWSFLQFVNGSFLHFLLPNWSLNWVLSLFHHIHHKNADENGFSMSSTTENLLDSSSCMHKSANLCQKSGVGKLSSNSDLFVDAGLEIWWLGKEFS